MEVSRERFEVRESDVWNRVERAVLAPTKPSNLPCAVAFDA